jgi:hypothetical protein
MSALFEAMAGMIADLFSNTHMAVFISGICIGLVAGWYWF